MPPPLPPPPSSLQRLFVFLLLLLVSVATGDDAAVMAKLANSLSTLPSSWGSGSNICSWDGVKCDSSKRVISISLAKKNLVGTLPSEFSELTQLRSLSLQNNKISGDLPSFSNFSGLKTLFLDSNNFTSLPGDFFRGMTSLETLSIADNPNLKPWKLPVDLSQCTSLVALTASQSNIFGSIPDVFTAMTGLQVLRLSYNNLTGSLPASFASSGIQRLWLNNQATGLTGKIDVISSMTQLTQLWLHKNQFTGAIPDLSKCVNIFDLQLRDNQLTGIVPASLPLLPNLLNVSLSNNKLQGAVPNFPATVTTVLNNGNNYCANVGVPCDPQVTTLLEIAGDLGFPPILSDDWKGNSVCSGWSFVSCDSRKNVITVNFGKRHFTGRISASFANLTFLTNLYLEGNNLTGTIPDNLTKLARLRVLDLSDNNLTGKIPEFPSLVKVISKPGNPLLSAGSRSGNGSSSSTSPAAGDGPRSSGSNRNGEGGKVSSGLIAGLVAGSAIVVAVFLLVLYQRKKQRKLWKKEKVSGKTLLVSELQQNPDHRGGGDGEQAAVSDGGNASISMEVLRQVTDNFSDGNVIGRGGFGVVYKGELHDGTKIAVKRMESAATGTKGLNEFQAEINTLSKVRHRHLVALLGYCVDGHDRVVVYEFMPQGTLAQHLFEREEHMWAPLTWRQRVTIALDVARGVEYLHSLAQQSFIHRDLKPSNILLGDDMRAKVADFGLVKHAAEGKHSMETRLAGTFGYLAPEYAATGRVTTKVDVYAFGVILMELITGRKALQDTFPDERSHLVTWFRKVMHNSGVRDTIDNTLKLDDEMLGSICKVAELAGHCTSREPYQRPDMSHAVNVLSPLIEQWRPTSEEEDDEPSGIDLHMSLSQALRKWQEDEGSSVTVDSSYNPTSFRDPRS